MTTFFWSAVEGLQCSEKKLIYRRETARYCMLVSSCYVSRGAS